MDQALKQWLAERKRGEDRNTKIWIFWEQKKLFKWNKNIFHNFRRAIIWWKIRPYKVNFLFCVSCPHLQKACAFGQFMDILPLLNLSWPSLFKIEIVSNNFNIEETSSGSLYSFSNRGIWLCPVLFIGLSMPTVRVLRQFFL